jgi:hypothetical protein
VSDSLWRDCLVGWVFLVVLDVELRPLHMLGV